MADCEKGPCRCDFIGYALYLQFATLLRLLDKCEGVDISAGKQKVTKDFFNLKDDKQVLLSCLTG